MKAVINLFFLSVFYLISQNLSATNLEQHWVVEGLKNPESVVYDQKRDRLYVSNVDGGATDKDGKGMISIISTDGSIVELEWIDGLHAPKGLTMHADKLYVTDIDTLVEIDIDTAMITQRYLVKDAKFLNDVVADSQGNVYVSDMFLNRIHKLQNGELELWLESPELEGPNGLHILGDQLIVGSWGNITEGFSVDVPGHLKQVDLATKNIQSIGDGTPIGHLDGVESDEHGGFYVTDWMEGALFYFDPAGRSELLLDLDQGSADHEIIIGKRLIVIPMMKNNLLVAYQIRSD